MNLEEIKELKRELDINVTELIQAFERKTELHVHGVDLNVAELTTFGDIKREKRTMFAHTRVNIP